MDTLEEGFIDDVSKKFKELLGDENSEFVSNIIEFMKNIRNKNNFNELKTAFDKSYEAHKSDINLMFSDLNNKQNMIRGSKAVYEVFVDVIKVIGITGLIAAPIPGTGPGLVVLLHVLLQRAFNVKLIPDSVFKAFRIYAERLKELRDNINKNEQVSFKEFL